VSYPVLVEVEKVVAEIPDNALDRWHVGPRKLNDGTSFSLGLEERNLQEQYRNSRYKYVKSYGPQDLEKKKRIL